MEQVSEIEERVERIEAALVALSVLQFGDSPGHPFRGNQHTGGSGPVERAAERVGKAVYDHLLAPGSGKVFDVHDPANSRAAAAEYKHGIGEWTKDIDAQMGDLSGYKHDPEGFADAITSTYGVPAVPIETGTDYAAVAVADSASHGAGLEPLAKFTEANGLDIYNDDYNKLTNEGHNPQVIAWDTGTSGQGPDKHDLADTLYEFEKNT